MANHKNSDLNNNFDNSIYDEDGFFIDANVFDNNYSSQKKIDPIVFKSNISESDNDINDNYETTKDVRGFRNKFIASNISQPVQTNYNYSNSNQSYIPQYQNVNIPQPLPLSYDEIVKNDYMNNINYDYNYNSEEIIEEDPFFNEESYKKKKTKLMIISLVTIFYLIFLIIGILNTNTIDGYAQLIDSEIKAERVVYNDISKKIIELSGNPQFGGEIELNELETTQRYSEKKVVYSNTALQYGQEITKYQKKQANEKNVYNQTMYEDYLTLIKSQKTILELAVSYYTAMEGSVSTQNLNLEKMKSNLLLADKTYSITFNTKIQALEDKKINLKLAKEK